MHMRTGPWYSSAPTREALEIYAARMPEGVVPYEAVPPATARMHSEYLRQLGYFTSNQSKNDYQFRAPVTAWDVNRGADAHWRSRETGQPFFSIINFNVTHESRIWGKSGDSLWVDPKLEVPIPPYLPDTETAKQDIRRMYSNIAEMDYRVGEVLDELEEDSLLESTIVFWYADHGGPLPRQKRAAYDSGLHVPMIIRYPNRWRAGEIDDRLISFIDFLPTLLSMSGAEPPRGIDGVAFEGRHRTTEPRKYVHAAVDRLDESPNSIRAVRDKRFKYLRHVRPELGMFVRILYRENMSIMQELYRLQSEGKLTDAQAQWFRSERPAEELFDLESDPHELRNLAADSAHLDKLVELREEADRWIEHTNDRGLLPEPEYLETIWPTGTQPVTAAPVASRTDGNFSLTSSTPGGLIGYQIRPAGDQLGRSWSIYSQPLELQDDEELVAIAHRIGYVQSDTTLVTSSVVAQFP